MVFLYQLRSIDLSNDSNIDTNLLISFAGVKGDRVDGIDVSGQFYTVFVRIYHAYYSSTLNI
jgi:hypothetical protein